MAIKIFVEGIADTKFIKDYILNQYNIKLDSDNINGIGGWSKIISDGLEGELIRNQLEKNTDNGGTNLVIFDADSNFQDRLKEIQDWKKKKDLSFNLFLWPNHSDNGDLETVLENIINPNNSPIFECWNDYETCLQAKNIEGRPSPLTTPAKKTKIYGYLEALLGESKSQKEKIKEKDRDYRKVEYWDLNSQFLGKLKYFLDPHYQQT